MSLSIVTNTASMMVRTNLSSATNSMNTAIERMTTGFKVNNAKDNAAGLNIIDTMTAKIGSFDMAYDNAQIGLDMLTTTEENYALITSHLQRVRDLTEQASNSTYSTESREAIQAEILARLQEIDRVAAIAEYNGTNLMDGSITDNVCIQVGLYGDTNSRIELDKSVFNETTTELLLGEGPTALAEKMSGLNTGAKAYDFLTTLDTALQDVASRVTDLGAAQNRLESAMTAIDTNIQQLTNSRGTMRDADVAEESTNFISAQVLQSAASTLLATANQTPSIALQLI